MTSKTNFKEVIKNTQDINLVKEMLYIALDDIADKNIKLAFRDALLTSKNEEIQTLKENLKVEKKATKIYRETIECKDKIIKRQQTHIDNLISAKLV